jgi:hypothetical protein
MKPRTTIHTVWKSCVHCHLLLRDFHLRIAFLYYTFAKVVTP